MRANERLNERRKKKAKAKPDLFKRKTSSSGIVKDSRAQELRQVTVKAHQSNLTLGKELLLEGTKKTCFFAISTRGEDKRCSKPSTSADNCGMHDPIAPDEEELEFRYCTTHSKKLAKSEIFVAQEKLVHACLEAAREDMDRRELERFAEQYVGILSASMHVLVFVGML